MNKAKQKPAANRCWFEIPADQPERAKKIYGALFGWKLNPFPGMQDCWHIDTAGPDASPDGGLMKRMHPDHTITQYVLVPSVSRFTAKVERLGGQICKPKTAVPNMGCLAICQDRENNTFALRESNPKAK